MNASDHDGFFDATEKRRADLRKIVEDIGAHLVHLPGSASAARNGLPESWAALVRLLDLEPAAEVARCATCGGLNMLSATRCGHCWIRLDPPVQSRVAAEAPGGVTEG